MAASTAEPPRPAESDKPSSFLHVCSIVHILHFTTNPTAFSYFFPPSSQSSYNYNVNIKYEYDLKNEDDSNDSPTGTFVGCFDCLRGGREREDE